MRAIVAGGAGFIGSYLCDRLLASGLEVTCFDNLLTGDRDNIRPLEQNPKFAFIEGDVTAGDVTHFFDLPADWIFHLASPASPSDSDPKGYPSLPVQTAMANVIGTHNLLELAKQQHSRFLFASTSEVYGNPDVDHHPQKETYTGNVDPTGPRSCYDESKRLGETFCSIYDRLYGVDVRVVRIFNTYGPRCDDGRMVPAFIKQALSQQPITVHGGGEQTRSLCFVGDLVQGILSTMECPPAAWSEWAREHPGEEWAKVVNLGNPEELTVRNYATVIKELAESSSAIDTAPPRPQGDPDRRRPDITKAMSLLHWMPNVDLKSGLLETIRWHKLRAQTQASSSSSSGSGGRPA